jgi:predicted esterase
MLKPNTSLPGKLLFLTVLVSFSILAGCAGGDSCSRSADDDGSGGGGGGTGGFCFNMSTAYCEPGETVNFTLLGGTPPYQFGYMDPADIQSYDNVSQMQATFDSDTGIGSYTVGPNPSCTDRLAAQDTDGAICYLTITVGDGSGGGGGGGGGGTGESSGGTGGQTGYATIANGYSYCPDSYDGSPWPLILLLHGMGGTADYFISEYKWAPTARTHGFLLCSLQSRSTYRGASGDEQNLLDMISYMKSKYNVRLDKICIFGFSNGASYAWAMGFKHPDIFKAIIACSNNGNTYNADDSNKVPCYVMWGAGESTHPGERTANELAARGWDVTTRQHSSGHTVPQSEIPAMGNWLNSKIP